MTNTVDSVWKKVQKGAPDECWPWVGAFKSTNGYGRMDVMNEEGVYAHRVAYLSANPGSISLRAPARDGNTFVLHRCDNPVCCNPAHLFLGSHDDNMRDKKQKGRSPDFKGSKGPRAKFNDSDVETIRRLLAVNLSSSEIARAYGVSKPTIKSIRCGRTY